MDATGLPAVPKPARGPAVVAAAVVGVAFVAGVALPSVDGLYAALVWLGAFSGLLLGPVFGLATAPLFRATEVGYAPPELTPEFASGYVRDAWRHHVGAATFYSALAGATGPYFLSVGTTAGVPLGGLALVVATGLAVGALFLASQLWRSKATDRSVPTETTLHWAVYGALLAVPPLVVLASWEFLWGSGVA